MVQEHCHVVLGQTLVNRQRSVGGWSVVMMYWGADKSLARPTSRCILFDGENISFDASLVMYT